MKTVVVAINKGGAGKTMLAKRGELSARWATPIVCYSQRCKCASDLKCKCAQ